MTTRSKFRIPTAEDMKKADDKQPKVQSLFSTHQAAVRANIQNPTGGSISTSGGPPTGGSSSTSGSSGGPTTGGSSSTSGSSGGPPTGGSSSTSGSNKLSSHSTNQNVQSSGWGVSGQKPGEVRTDGDTVTTRVMTTDAGGGKVTDMPARVAGESTSIGSSSLIKPVLPDNTDGKTSTGRPKTNSLLVSSRQRGNPILKHIRNVPWEFEDIVPDYQMGQANCALFLSLRYHQLNPNYIHERLKQLGRSYALRVLLTLIDIKDPHHSLKELAKICILADCTLVVAFSQDEAGRYLETYRAYENKPPELIMEKTEGNHMTRLTECLTKVRRVNKTDAMTLMSAFGSFEKIVKSSEDELSLCPGFGPQKAQRLYSAFHEPFLKSKRKSLPTKQAGGATGSPQKQRKSDKS